MKKLTLFIALFSFSLFAKEGDTIMKCDLGLSGVGTLEFVEDYLPASAVMILSGVNGEKSEYYRIDDSEIYSGNIELPFEWFGYNLKLRKSSSNNWFLYSADECSSSIAMINCSLE